MEDSKSQQSVGLNFNVDPFKTPILYADVVYTKSNDNGMVLDIGQQIGDTQQFNIIARIGFSKEHIKRLIENLEAQLRTEGMRSTEKKN